ncbi:MAG: DoxX family protein [Enterobacterales bacterium]|nr:DoxX family protein [Enterobacterales bacterium]
MSSLLNTINGLLAPAKKIPESLTLLVARIALATVFWKSAQTKIASGDFLGQKWAFYDLSASTTMLFEYEYDLPLIPPEIAAYMATFAEFFLSIFILLGLFTRLSAFGFLMMTLVIQVFVYPDAWPTHILWAGLLLYVLKEGPGKLSLDRVLGK